MAMSVHEVKEWLSWLEDEHRVCIDDGGLSLQMVGDPGVFIEIGGDPEYDDDDQDEEP